MTCKRTQKSPDFCLLFSRQIDSPDTAFSIGREPKTSPQLVIFCLIYNAREVPFDSGTGIASAGCSQSDKLIVSTLVAVLPAGEGNKSIRQQPFPRLSPSREMTCKRSAKITSPQLVIF
jgi:hypothetical protein